MNISRADIARYFDNLDPRFAPFVFYDFVKLEELLRAGYRAWVHDIYNKTPHTYIFLNQTPLPFDVGFAWLEFNKMRLNFPIPTETAIVYRLELPVRLAERAAVAFRHGDIGVFHYLGILAARRGRDLIEAYDQLANRAPNEHNWFNAPVAYREGNVRIRQGGEIGNYLAAGRGGAIMNERDGPRREIQEVINRTIARVNRRQNIENFDAGAEVAAAVDTTDREAVAETIAEFAGRVARGGATKAQQFFGFLAGLFHKIGVDPVETGVVRGVDIGGDFIPEDPAVEMEEAAELIRAIAEDRQEDEPPENVPRSLIAVLPQGWRYNIRSTFNPMLPIRFVRPSARIMAGFTIAGRTLNLVDFYALTRRSVDRLDAVAALACTLAYDGRTGSFAAAQNSVPFVQALLSEVRRDSQAQGLTYEKHPVGMITYEDHKDQLGSSILSAGSDLDDFYTEQRRKYDDNPIDAEEMRYIEFDYRDYVPFPEDHDLLVILSKLARPPFFLGRFPCHYFLMNALENKLESLRKDLSAFPKPITVISAYMNQQDNPRLSRFASGIFRMMRDLSISFGEIEDPYVTDFPAATANRIYTILRSRLGELVYMGQITLLCTNLIQECVNVLQGISAYSLEIGANLHLGGLDLGMYYEYHILLPLMTSQIGKITKLCTSISAMLDIVNEGIYNKLAEDDGKEEAVNYLKYQREEEYSMVPSHVLEIEIPIVVPANLSNEAVLDLYFGNSILTKDNLIEFVDQFENYLVGDRDYFARLAGEQGGAKAINDIYNILRKGKQDFNFLVSLERILGQAIIPEDDSFVAVDIDFFPFIQSTVMTLSNMLNEMYDFEDDEQRSKMYALLKHGSLLFYVIRKGAHIVKIPSLLELLQICIEAAKLEGTPEYTEFVRKSIASILEREGTLYVNTDDVQAAVNEADIVKPLVTEVRREAPEDEYDNLDQEEKRILNEILAEDDRPNENDERFFEMYGSTLNFCIARGSALPPEKAQKLLDELKYLKSRISQGVLDTYYDRIIDLENYLEHWHKGRLDDRVLNIVKGNRVFSRTDRYLGVKEFGFFGGFRSSVIEFANLRGKEDLINVPIDQLTEFVSFSSTASTYDMKPENAGNLWDDVITVVLTKYDAESGMYISTRRVPDNDAVTNFVRYYQILMYGHMHRVLTSVRNKLVFIWRMHALNTRQALIDEGYRVVSVNSLPFWGGWLDLAGSYPLLKTEKLEGIEYDYSTMTLFSESKATSTVHINLLELSFPVLINMNTFGKDNVLVKPTRIRDYIRHKPGPNYNYTARLNMRTALFDSQSSLNYPTLGFLETSFDAVFLTICKGVAALHPGFLRELCNKALAEGMSPYRFQVKLKDAQRIIVPSEHKKIEDYYQEFVRLFSNNQ